MDQRQLTELIEQLARPFPVKAVKWKPQSVKGNRAMALAYIDARTVTARLDEVFPLAWQDEYSVLDKGSVVCRLSVRIDGQWLTRCDVGGESEQPDEGDRTKAAFSDALKRAAVKFGVGRYLYSLPRTWCDYDPQKKQFSQTPQLPDWAIPKGDKSTPSAPSKQSPSKQAATSETASKLLLNDLYMIDDTIRKKDKTWTAALKHIGIVLPDGFVEPESDAHVASLASVVTPDQAAKLKGLLKLG